MQIKFLLDLLPRIPIDDFILVRFVFGGGEEQVGERNVVGGLIIGKVRNEHSSEYTAQQKFRSSISYLRRLPTNV